MKLALSSHNENIAQKASFTLAVLLYELAYEPADMSEDVRLNQQVAKWYFCVSSFK